MVSIECANILFIKLIIKEKLYFIERFLFIFSHNFSFEFNAVKFSTCHLSDHQFFALKRPLSFTNNSASVIF